jgi:hypothetical protein
MKLRVLDLETTGMAPPHEVSAAIAVARRHYVTLACRALTVATSVADLETWFRAEADNRERLGIKRGDREFDRIVKAAAAHKAKLIANAEKSSATIPTTEPPNGCQLENRLD